MKVGVTLEDEKGLLGNVAQHFGQCKYFFLANIEDNKIRIQVLYRIPLRMAAEGVLWWVSF